MARAIKKGDTPTEVAVCVIADKYVNSAGIAQAFLAQFARGVKSSGGKTDVTDTDTGTAA